jgi:hypothetical protein
MAISLIGQLGLIVQLHVETATRSGIVAVWTRLMVGYPVKATQQNISHASCNHVKVGYLCFAIQSLLFYVAI